MRSEEARVQADAGNPLPNETRVLSGREASVRSTSTGEQILAWLLIGGFHMVVDSLPCYLGQFEPNRATSLLLPHRVTFSRVPAGRNVIDLESDDVATTQL